MRSGGRLAWGVGRLRVGYDADWETLVESYREFVTPASMVLDVGASKVHKTRFLAPLCRELVGVELFARRRPSDFANVRYVLGDFQRLSEVVEPGSVDVAVASHVIEHVADDAAALRELHKVLRPGGVALVHTPNRARITRAIVEAVAGRRRFPWREHRREYTPAELGRLAARSPFERFEVRPVVFGVRCRDWFVYLDPPPGYLAERADMIEVRLFKDANVEGEEDL